MATKQQTKKTTKKRVSRNISAGQVHIKTSFEISSYPNQIIYV